MREFREGQAGRAVAHRACTLRPGGVLRGGILLCHRGGRGQKLVGQADRGDGACQPAQSGAAGQAALNQLADRVPRRGIAADILDLRQAVVGHDAGSA
jgi:hypothetical protein